MACCQTISLPGYYLTLHPQSNIWNRHQSIAIYNNGKSLYLTLAYHFQVIYFLHYNNVGRSPWVIYLVSLSVMQLPYICSYQAANYTIEVLEKGTNVSFEEGPFRYVNRDDRIKIQSELRPNWNYTATVIVETVAWSINSSISFSKHSWDSCKLHNLSCTFDHMASI